MEASFELFDHTADVGVQMRAADMPGLLKPAVDGLYEVIGRLEPDRTAQPQQREFKFQGDEPEVMLRDFLAEMLIMFEQDEMMAVEVVPVAFDRERLAAKVTAAPLDKDRSDLRVEVKAITYHGLKVDTTDGGYEAEYIVDI